MSQKDRRRPDPEMHMSTGEHLTCEELKSLKDRASIPGHQRQLVLDHLARCPGCAGEYAAWQQQRHGREYDRALRPLTLPSSGDEHSLVSPVDDDPVQVESAFRQLAALPEEFGRRETRRARGRFRGIRLAERLIEESDRSLPGNPGESARFAGLAYEVAVRSGRAGITPAVRATARSANAKRIAGKKSLAGSLFTFARQLAAAERTVPKVVAAELDRLARLYARAGRSQKVRETAAPLPTVFQSFGLHREAAAALELFLAAVR
jgi:hypothetical protein